MARKYTVQHMIASHPYFVVYEPNPSSFSFLFFSIVLCAMYGYDSLISPILLHYIFYYYYYFIFFCVVVVDLYALHVAVRLNVFLSQTNSRLALGRQAREPAGYWTGE